MEVEGQVGRLSEIAAEGTYMKADQIKGGQIYSFLPKMLGTETIWLSEAVAFK